MALIYTGWSLKIIILIILIRLIISCVWILTKIAWISILLRWEGLIVYLIGIIGPIWILHCLFLNMNSWIKSVISWISSIRHLLRILWKPIALLIVCIHCWRRRSKLILGISIWIFIWDFLSHSFVKWLIGFIHIWLLANLPWWFFLWNTNRFLIRRPIGFIGFHFF